MFICRLQAFSSGMQPIFLHQLTSFLLKNALCSFSETVVLFVVITVLKGFGDE